MTNNAQRIQFLVAQEDGFTRSRLPALYSDFRGLRTTNPEGYAANISAWRRGLASLVRGGMLPPSSAAPPSSSKTKKSPALPTGQRNFLVLTAGQQLLDALQSDRYGRPLALDAVVHDAVQDRDLIPVQVFLMAKESIYNRRSWASALAALPWNALFWGLQQLGVAGESGSGSSSIRSGSQAHEGRIPSDQFVVVANVEAAAAAFAEKTADLRSPFERTWSVAHFKRIFSSPGAVLDDLPAPAATLAVQQQPRFSGTDLDVLLTFLARDKNLVAYDGHVVKLRASGDDKTITEEDRAVAQLRELIDSLSHQTAVLSGRIDELAAMAKDAVLRKNRVAALAALRQKKQAEAALTTRFATLTQLEATAAKLEEASDQVAVVAALASSGDALRSLNAKVGGAEGVTDVVDRLRDQMDAADEIGRILTEAGPTSTTAGGTGLVIDEGEIDEELAALEKEEQRTTEEAERARKEEAEKRAAEETRQRLAAAGMVPEAVSTQEGAQAQDEAALEAETTESLRNLSLKSDEPQAELAS